MKRAKSLTGILLALLFSLLLASFLGPMSAVAVANDGGGGGSIPPTIIPTDTTDPGHISDPSGDSTGWEASLFLTLVGVLF